MKFDEKIKKLRKGKHLTQHQLAEKLGVTRPCVSKWESAYNMPSIDTLRALAKIFSISLDELLSDNDIFVMSDETKRMEEEIFMWFMENLTRRMKHSMEIEDKFFELEKHKTLV